MTNLNTTPESLESQQTDSNQTNTGNPSWHKGMKSPNPKGRPKGILDKRHKITETLLNDTQEIADVVIAKAKEGDLQAASLILARVLPTLATQSEKVQFNLDPSAPLATQVEQVLAATAEGGISPDSAKRVIETIGALGTIRQMDEVEQRLAALEKKKS